MIVGRSSECREILRLREAAETGRGAARVVSGAPGSGKSALLRWTAEHPGTARVVTVEGTDDTRGVLALFGAVVAALSDELALLATEQADLLRSVLVGAAGEPEILGLGGALLSLLTFVARERPLVLLVDGAESADGASREALVAAVRHLEDQSVLVVLAERDCHDGGFALQLPTIDLAGLSPLDAAVLLNGDVDTRVAEELGRETGGNPLALLDIAARLSPEQRRGEVPLDPALPLGEALRRGFLARTEMFGLDESRVLLLASTDSGLDCETLTHAARRWGIGPAAVDRIVTPSLVQVERSGVVRFTHPLLRATVYQSATPDDRRTAHRIIAASLSVEDDVDRWARHLAASADGPDPVAADALAAAAQTIGTGSVAAETWQRAALLTADASRRQDRLLAAGAAYVAAGEHLRGVEAFDDALVIADDVDRRADVLVRRSMPAIEALGTRGLREQLDEVSAELDPSDPRFHVLVAMSGAVAMLEGDFVGAHDILRSESEAPPGPTRTMLDVARLLTGDITEIDEIVAYAERLARSDDARFRNDEFLVFALTWAGEHSAASRLVDSLVTSRRSAGATIELAFALSARAHLYFRTGHWDAARVDAEEAVALAAGSGRPTTLTRALFVLARIEAAVGDTDLAIEHGLASYDLGERYGLGALSWHASAAIGFAFLGDGRPTDAVEWLERARAFGRARGVSLIATSLSDPDLVEAHLHCGSPDAARIVDELAVMRPERQGVLGHALFLRCRALAGGRDAVVDYEAALRLHAEVHAPFEEARTRLCFGEQIRRDRDVALAYDHLAAAAESFAQLGATRWRRRAEREVAACARGRAGSTDIGRAASLTPQEYRVAIEVAQGATSREVAAALFLSPRTVEYHLGKIYRKLGLRSRSDLVRRVATDPGFSGRADPRR